MTVPVVDARGSPGRPAAERRTPSIAVVSSGRACRAISARSSASVAVHEQEHTCSRRRPERLRASHVRERSSRIVHRSRQFCSHAPMPARLVRSMHAEQPLHDTKIAIVTGGSSGIGRHAAIRIAERGAGVILTYNSNPDGARGDRRGDRGARRHGRRPAARRRRQRRPSTPSRERVAAELADRWQRTSFDHLVNNAGFGQMSMFADTTEELYDRVPPGHPQGARSSSPRSCCRCSPTAGRSSTRPATRRCPPASSPATPRTRA